MSSQPVLAVSNVHKAYGAGATATPVLNGLSFTVEPNQVVALLGANGAGKTTLVNIASTLLLPDSGTPACSWPSGRNGTMTSIHIPRWATSARGSMQNNGNMKTRSTLKPTGPNS